LLQERDGIPLDLQDIIVFEKSKHDGDGTQTDLSVPSSQEDMHQEEVGGTSEPLYTQDSDPLYVPDFSQASSHSSVGTQKPPLKKTKLWLVTMKAILSLFRFVHLYQLLHGLCH
jgi:hypothetical protein